MDLSQIFNVDILVECLPVVLVLNAAGVMIKRWNKISNNWIPVILLACAPFAAAFFMFLNEDISFNLAFVKTCIVQGILCFASAIGVHQVGAQTFKLFSNKKEDGSGTDTSIVETVAKETALKMINEFLGTIMVPADEVSADDIFIEDDAQEEIHGKRYKPEEEAEQLEIEGMK